MEKYDRVKELTGEKFRRSYRSKEEDIFNNARNSRESREGKD